MASGLGTIIFLWFLFNFEVLYRLNFGVVYVGVSLGMSLGRSRYDA